MTPLVRLFIRQGLFGLALGLIFAILVVGFNVANLRHLVQNVQGGYMAFWLLAFGFVLGFATTVAEPALIAVTQEAVRGVTMISSSGILCTGEK